MPRPGDMWVEQAQSGQWFIWAFLPTQQYQIFSGPWDTEAGAQENIRRMIAWSDARATGG